MQKELLSAYMDGEQVSSELTTELCNDAELQQSWASFHSIRSIMREETPVFLGADFTAKMAELIDAEPNVVAQVDQPTPEEMAHIPFVQKLKAMFAPLTQVAVAAAVCLIAVFGVQTFNAKQIDKTADTPVLQTMPFISNAQQVSYNAPAKDVLNPEQRSQKNKNFGIQLKNIEDQRNIKSVEIQR